MSDQPESEISMSSTASADAAFEREKWAAEKAFRELELVLKEREQKRLEDELRLRQEESRRFSLV